MSVSVELLVPIETSRLLLKPPHAGDGAAVNAAILESFDELHAWMPWAHTRPTVEETEAFTKEAAENWRTREDLVFWIFDRATGEFVGSIGFRRINWQVPCVEIGYWLRTSKTGQGYMVEATQALTNYAFDILKAKRIEIRCDEDNLRSRKIPERLGYQLDAILKMNDVKVDGTPRNTAIYSKTVNL